MCLRVIYAFLFICGEVTAKKSGGFISGNHGNPLYSASGSRGSSKFIDKDEWDQYASRSTKSSIQGHATSSSNGYHVRGETNGVLYEESEWSRNWWTYLPKVFTFASSSIKTVQANYLIDK
jgi:hypothetical protein